MNPYGIKSTHVNELLADWNAANAQARADYASSPFERQGDTIAARVAEHSLPPVQESRPCKNDACDEPRAEGHRRCYMHANDAARATSKRYRARKKEGTK